MSRRSSSEIQSAQSGWGIRRRSGILSERMKILIGCVGPEDPISQRGERPILTAARALRPECVELIYSASTLEACIKTKEKLWTECGLQLDSKSLHHLDITNPTDYDQIIEPLVQTLQEIGAHAAPDPEFHLVESGTPQIRSILMLAAVSKLVKEARVWHVDDPSPPGQSAEKLSQERAHQEAVARLHEVNLNPFSGAALQFFGKIRLHLQVIQRKDEAPEIQGELVPGYWLKRDSRGRPMRMLLELCKARRGDAYQVRANGGWIRTNRLRDGYEKLPSGRTIARDAINEELANLAHGPRRVARLIEARGATKVREFRISLEPEEIFIK